MSRHTQESTVPPPAIPLTKNSHATATAWVARYFGVGAPAEADETLVATAWVYIRGCPACDDPDSSDWDITGGLKELLADRGVERELTERYWRATDADRRVTFEDITRAVRTGHPVIATFCGERSAAIPALAAQRAGNCFSVAVIGTIIIDGSAYVVARDGLAEDQSDEGSPFRAGLDPQVAGPWREPGTGLYAWEGSNTNIVLTMLVEPESER